MAQGAGGAEFALDAWDDVQQRLREEPEIDDRTGQYRGAVPVGEDADDAGASYALDVVAEAGEPGLDQLRGSVFGQAEFRITVEVLVELALNEFTALNAARCGPRYGNRTSQIWRAVSRTGR
ncbi:hypothetical protein [Arthrobacter sp. Marseille-P9274]|uniref:hypothetical protein n=1 Tax=Arthrobacter sp. Marseille-P9274 TaxID=2866572 RepID=UPI0027B9C830|nr:hypothetical protein [Arthrobacter sp. Marseille-P9274]